MIASAVVDIRQTLGASFVGLLVSVTLFGMTIIQGWIFFVNGRRDPVRLKIFVAILIAFDALHTVLCIYGIYWYLVLNFGNVENLDLGMWAMNGQAEINALVAYLVQLFYARRVYILSHNIIIAMLIVLLGGTCFVAGFIFTVKSFFLKRFSRFNSLDMETIVGMGGAALADILIAGSMCWYLYHKRTTFPKTNSVIMTLMAYSINSGLITSILATCTLVFFITGSSRQLIWQAIFWMLGKCYVNSLLAMLNSRDYLWRFAYSDSNDGYGLSSLAFGHSKTENKSNKGGSTAVTLNIHQSAATDSTVEKDEYNAAPESSPLEPKIPGIVTSEHAV